MRSCSIRVAATAKVPSSSTSFARLATLWETFFVLRLQVRLRHPHSKQFLPTLSDRRYSSLWVFLLLNIVNRVFLSIRRLIVEGITPFVYTHQPGTGIDLMKNVDSLLMRHCHRIEEKTHHAHALTAPNARLAKLMVGTACVTLGWVLCYFFGKPSDSASWRSERGSETDRWRKKIRIAGTPILGELLKSFLPRSKKTVLTLVSPGESKKAMDVNC